MAELLESGKEQPWGGSGPPQPQPMEEPVDVPIPWRAASCLHWDGKHQVQAASRVLQTLATNLWVPLGRDQHRDEACGESLSSKGRRGAGWEVQDLLLRKWICPIILLISKSRRQFNWRVGFKMKNNTLCFFLLFCNCVGV